jgi:hypothetical protein
MFLLEEAAISSLLTEDASGVGITLALLRINFLPFYIVIVPVPLT